MPNGSEERSGREVRLLVLVIVVAVAGLIVLARFRFPTADIVTVSPTPPPLERLSVREPFDDLAAAVAAGAARANPVVAVVTLEAESAPSAKPAKKSAEPPVPIRRRRIPGLRVRPDRLLAYVPPEFKPMIVGGQPAQVASEDPKRRLVVLSEPLRPDRQGAAELVDFAAAASGFVAPNYVLAVEAGAEGTAVRPIFIARLDPMTAEPWDSPVREIGGDLQVGPGVFLFTLDGRLIGLTVPHDGGLAVVSAATLDRLVRELTGSGQ